MVVASLYQCTASQISNTEETVYKLASLLGNENDEIPIERSLNNLTSDISYFNESGACHRRLSSAPTLEYLTTSNLNHKVSPSCPVIHMRNGALVVRKDTETISIQTVDTELLTDFSIKSNADLALIIGHDVEVHERTTLARSQGCSEVYSALEGTDLDTFINVWCNMEERGSKLPSPDDTHHTRLACLSFDRHFDEVCKKLVLMPDFYTR